MEIKYIETNSTRIAEILSDGIVIRNTRDALDVMADCTHNSAGKIILDKDHLAPEFYDLKTGIAGEILQKFVTYHVEVAIVGDFSGFSSKSLRDFIYECNNGRMINFLASKEEAVAVLSGGH